MNDVYLISEYETGQYGHEAFDFIIMRNDDPDTVRTGKSIPQPEKSDLYRKAKTNITGIIYTDNALLNLTTIPEHPCEGSVNPCSNAKCNENLNEQHHFECICNTGYSHSTDMRYKCQGLKICFVFFLHIYHMLRQSRKSEPRRFYARLQYYFLIGVTLYRFY